MISSVLFDIIKKAVFIILIIREGVELSSRNENNNYKVIASLCLCGLVFIIYFIVVGSLCIISVLFLGVSNGILLTQYILHLSFIKVVGSIGLVLYIGLLPYLVPRLAKWLAKNMPKFPVEEEIEPEKIEEIEPEKIEEIEPATFEETEENGFVKRCLSNYSPEKTFSTMCGLLENESIPLDLFTDSNYRSLHSEFQSRLKEKNVKDLIALQTKNQVAIYLKEDETFSFYEGEYKRARDGILYSPQRNKSLWIVQTVRLINTSFPMRPNRYRHAVSLAILAYKNGVFEKEVLDLYRHLGYFQSLHNEPKSAIKFYKIADEIAIEMYGIDSIEVCFYRNFAINRIKKKVGE